MALKSVNVKRIDFLTYGLYAVILAFAFKAVNFAGGSPVRYISVLALAGYALYRVLRPVRSFPFELNLYDMLIILFTVHALISGVYARDFADYQRIVQPLLINVVFYFVICDFAQSWRRIQGLQWFSVLSVAIIVGTALLQLAGVQIVPLSAEALKTQNFHGLLRISGTYGDPNYAALVIFSVVPLLYLSAKATSSKVLKAILIVFVVTGILTFSRMGLLILCGLGLALGFAQRTALWLKVRKLPVLGTLCSLIRKYLRTIILIILLILVLASLWFVLHHANLINDPSIHSRLVTKEIAFKMIADHPMFGVGLGNFVEYSLDYWIHGNPRLRTFAHDGYLEIAAELGIWGWLLALTAFVSLGKEAWSMRRWANRVKHPYTNLLIYQEAALYVFAFGLFFLSAEYDKYLWLLFGLVSASHKLTKQEREHGNESFNAY